MIPHPARRLLRPLRRARDAARGHRPGVALPLDMFDAMGTPAQLNTARKLGNLYHKGQARAWNGREVLAELVDRHGPPSPAEPQRRALQTLFAVILWGELAAWKVSADLAHRLEPLEAKLAATAQVHDEARHFYVMHDYLELLGEVPRTLGPATEQFLRDVIEAPSLLHKLIGMQLMIEPLALTLFHIVRERRLEPVLADLLLLYERDEARHVALGVLHLPRMLRGLTPLEAADLWTWEFVGYWRQLRMVRELEPAFRALDIDPREVVRLGRDKQVKANQLLVEELGTDLPALRAILAFFDAKLAWEFPDCDRADWVERALGAVRASRRGLVSGARLAPA